MYNKSDRHDTHTRTSDRHDTHTSTDRHDRHRKGGSNGNGGVSGDRHSGSHKQGSGAGKSTKAKLRARAPRKTINKADRRAYRKRARKLYKKISGSRIKSRRYARYVQRYLLRQKRLYRSYGLKAHVYRKRLDATKPYGSKEWRRLYSKWYHYIRYQIHWYQRYMHFQRIRRRRFKYHSQTWWVLTKDINRYALRYKYFLKFYRSRIAYWRRGMNQQSKAYRRLQRARHRAKRARVWRRRRARYRYWTRHVWKYRRHSSKYTSAIEHLNARYKQILARYEAKNTYWTGRVDKQTACTRSFYRDNRWMGYYRRRLLRLYRNYNNFLGRRRRRLKRTTQEYQQVSKDKIELMRKLTGLYKNQTRRYKTVWACYKGNRKSRGYRKWRRYVRRSSRWTQRLRAGRRARQKRHAYRNRRKLWKYRVMGKRYQARFARIEARWQRVMAVYKRYQAYYAGKMSQRRVGGRWWRVAYYRWRRYSWRGYKWYSWYIRLLRRRRRYLKRFPDEYKKVSAQIVQLQKDRSAWYAAYKGAVSAWVTKLQAARGSGRAYRRVAKSQKRNASRGAWRQSWKDWRTNQRIVLRSRWGTSTHRVALYRTYKAMRACMVSWRHKARKYRHKLRGLKRGSRRYWHYYKYMLWWQRYVLFGYRRIGRFFRVYAHRMRRGSARRAWAVRTAAAYQVLMMRYFKYFRKNLKYRYRVSRRGGRARRYWRRWRSKYRRYYRRYRKGWRARRKARAKRYRRRIWRKRWGGKAQRKYEARVWRYWYRIWRYYVRRQHYYKKKLYRYRAGTYRWRIWFHRFRTSWARMLRWANWQIRFQKKMQRRFRSNQGRYKVYQSKIDRWNAWRRKLVDKWNGYLAYWANEVKSKRAKKTIARQTRRAGRYTNFRSLWKAYYYDRYYVLRSKVGDARYNQYQPKMAGDRKALLDWYKRRRDAYKARMDKYGARTRHYRRYFKLFMYYNWRIIRILRYDVRYHFRWLRMLRRHTDQYRAAKASLRVSRGELKAAYDANYAAIRHRYSQIRRNGREWKRWARWRRWYRHRMARRRARKYRRTYTRSAYWYHRFHKLRAGSTRWSHALKRMQWYYTRTRDSYKRWTAHWKGKLGVRRAGSRRWWYAFRRYRAYNRHLIHLYYWWMKFDARYRRFYKAGSAEYNAVNADREATRQEKDAAVKDYIATMQLYVGKIDQSKYARVYGKVNSFYMRYQKRYSTYRNPVKELRVAEHAWWALRATAQTDAGYLSAWNNMIAKREAVLKAYDGADANYRNKMAQYKNHRSRGYRYWFRRSILYRYYKWREMHRGAWFVRYRLRHGLTRGSQAYVNIENMWRNEWGRMALLYKNMKIRLRGRLHELSRRSREYQYWYRWYRWAVYKTRRYYRWKTAYARRRLARWRTAFWSYKYGDAQYVRRLRHVWSYWLRRWKNYIARMNRWRAAVRRHKLGHRAWRYSFRRSMRYAARGLKWIGWWIRFTRRRQRVFTKQGDGNYERLEKEVAAWSAFRTKYVGVVSARVKYWRGRLHSGSRAYRLVNIYYKTYSGRETWRSVYRTLRAEEYKAWRGSPDWAKIKEYRAKLVAFFDEHAKKWDDYVAKQPKASRKYIYGYRHMFWWKYYGLREYKRGWKIATAKKDQATADSDKAEAKKRYEELAGRLTKDQDGLVHSSWLYRALRGTVYWLGKYYAWTQK